MSQQTPALRDPRPTLGHEPSGRPTPDAPDAPDAPDVPHALEVPHAPDAPGAPDAPHAPTVSRIMTENADLSTVANLLADEHVQRILAATSVEPKSKTELTEACDASLQTVSRRVDELEATDLVREETRARPDGHHDAVYVASLDRFEVHLRDGDLEHDVTRMDRDMTDELQRLWRKF